MKQQQRHAKILQFSMEQILNLFFLLGQEQYCVPVLDNIPKDVILRKVWFDQFSDTFNFWLEYSSFPEVSMGATPIVEDGTYTILDTRTGEGVMKMGAGKQVIP